MKKIISLIILISCFITKINAQDLETELNSNISMYKKYVSEKNYTAAIPYIKKSALLVKQKYGEQNKDYLTLINSTGTLYFFISKFDTAVLYYDTTLTLYKKYYSADKEGLLQTHLNLAMSYNKMEDYTNAKKWYEIVVASQKELYGTNSKNYRMSYGNLANVYKNLGLYEEAEKMMLENIDYYEKMDSKSEAYEIALQNLAALYQKWGLHYWAAMYYFIASDVRLVIAGENDTYFKNYISNATFYFEKAAGECRKDGDFERAEKCYNYNTIIFKERKNNKEYARFLNLRGLMELELKKYTNAEISFFTALQIFKKEFDTTHLSVGMVYNNIGMLYFNLNRYDFAEDYCYEGYKIRLKRLKPNDKDIAESCCNLGLIYTYTMQYEKAEEFNLKAKQIYENGIGTNNSEYAIALNNLGMLYWKKKNYKDAEKYYLQSLQLREKLYGKEHTSYARILNNLGTIYLEWENPTKAIKYFEQAVAISEKKFGKNHIRNIPYLNNLALCYNDLGNYNEAKKIIINTNQLNSKLIKDNFTILTEYEKELYADEILYNSKYANSILYNSRNYNSENIIDNLNQQLQLKGLVLNETKTFYNYVKNNSDTAFQKMFNEYSQLKTRIAREYGFAIENRSKDLSSWEGRVDVLEKDLLLKSKKFTEQQKGIEVNYNTLKNSLKEDEVLIEFAKFNLYNKGETDSVLYVAYIVTKNGNAPVYVPLFEESELQKILTSAGKTNQALASNLYRSTITKNKSKANFGNELYNLVWQPLEPYLKNKKKIYFAPVNKLNTIAFNALAIDSNTYLIDKYQLFQYTSTRMFVQDKKEVNKVANIALFGNADFSLTQSTIKTYQQNADSAIVKRGFNKENTTLSTWATLPGTAEEIKNIGTLFSKKSIPQYVYTNTNASEENLKKLNDQNISIIHLATHGFFLPKIKETQQSISNSTTTNYNTAYDPMLRSGIVLSGANYAWNGGFVPSNKEDGIVTAYEISQLNLSNTNLVVLSACETALGDIMGNEGVYGLQRAFKLAGVKNIILSLWQVPDKETAELMTIFYNNYLSGKSINESFNLAQQSLRKKYSPYYWAAFVLIK
ncbi:MAG TPA: CHAT domain-containing protein [Chitinophagaceae bacterium]|nr:CHAT domain-containing protein [Chitinophagaceae bacterium]